MELNRLKIDRSATPRRRRGNPWWGRGIVLVGVVVAGWFFRGPIGAWLDRLRLPEVAVERVTRRSPVSSGALPGAAANGYVVARVRAALSADTPGRIVEINVEEGQAVPEGYVVARLYAKEYAASLRQAEANLGVGTAAVERARAEKLAADSARKQLEAAQRAARAALDVALAEERLAILNHDRIKELVEDGVESVADRDETRARLETAQARVASATADLAAADAAHAQGVSRVEVAVAAVDEAVARLEVLSAARDLAAATLEKTEVRAPFDGIVVLKDAEVGEVVSPNSTAASNARGSVVTMVDFASLEAQAEVPETSLAAVRLGGAARIFLDAFPDKPYRGRVDRIWPTADRQKATIEVRIAFEEPDKRLRPEMGVRVVFLDDGYVAADGPSGEGGEVVLVPSDSIVRSESVTGVFVLERDVVRLRRTELGAERAGRVVVKTGLDGGELVVRNPAPNLEDGDRVRQKDQ